MALPLPLPLPLPGRKLALLGAIASFIGAGLLLILSILGLMHERRVPADTEVLAKTLHTTTVTA